MPATKQEIAAELVWRYVEHIRECGPDAATEMLTRADLQQLVEVLETAGTAGGAVLGFASDAAAGEARARLEAVIAHARPQKTAASSGTPPAGRGFLPLQWLRRPAPAWVTAVSMAAGLAFAVSTAGVWHRPAPVVQTVRVRIPVDVPDVEPVDEAQVHKLLPRMVRNQLGPQDEKNLMWHMLICPGCFNEYVSLKNQALPTLSEAVRYRRVARR